jgi:hypothetical protein
LAGEVGTALHHLGIRVDVEIVEWDRVDAGGLKEPDNSADVAGLQESMIGDKQRLGETEVAGLGTNLTGRAGPEDEAGSQVEGERLRHRRVNIRQRL